MSRNLKAYNIFDLREKALKRVPKGLFEFVDRGTEDEVSLRNNRAVCDRMRPAAIPRAGLRSVSATKAVAEA